MNINLIPPKIIRTVLSFVPRESLASSSLVCKTWRTAAYALLYESALLVSTTNGSYSSPWLNFSSPNSHPEELVHRIIRETNDDGPFQISSCVRRLTVAWEMNEQQIQTFGSAVLRMKNLENLSWVVSVIDNTRWYDTLLLLCKKLPKLRSVKLVIGEHELDIPDMDMGALIGLRELAVGFDPQEETFEWEIPNSIIQLIIGAQNIESLTLWAQASDVYPSAISYNFGEDDIMSRLSLHSFPHLCRFSIGPFHSEVSLKQIVNPTFGLWRFARNQKQLREVVCYGNEGSMLGWDITSGHTESVPMIHRFKGSAFEVCALLRLNLVRQLEILELVHAESSASAGISDSRLSDLLEVLRNTHGIELPCMRSLKLSMSGPGIGTSNNVERAINVLGILASGAPKLQELIVSTSRPPTPYIQASPAHNTTQSVY
ncbi:unnamed protein product [Rhizoctonia solani]|uniref:F-box domain-containing protein n=1 Tax=Rhizoctonia solani TaxID=456999 RepID=A0A8H3DEF5_9AGAM|nr:unnamed protein product [Rhizoctonia solani]